MADFTPEPHYVMSVRNQGLSWWKALSELIDNGFDAKADRVEICVKGKTVSVSDNGRGMQNVVQAVKLGGHVPSYGRGLGMYGVGLKDAWLSSGDKIEIDTVHSGIRTVLCLDIRDIASNWNGPDPVVSPCGDKNGTRITLHVRPGRNIPSTEVFQKLAFIFSPAISQGLQIVLTDGKKAKPLAVVAMPPFSEAIQDTFDIDGKSVSINIGILKHGSRMPEGPFCFAYRHRVIEGSSLGSKGMSCMQLGGFVTLGDGWVFTKNKDAIAECEEALEEAIFSRIKPLLQKASQMAIDVQSNAIRTELEMMMNEAVGSAKREARSSGGGSLGTVKPVDSGKKRTRAAKIHADLPGSVIESGNGTTRRGLKIDWCQVGSDHIGKYDARTNTVNMNLDHPFVAAVKVTSNMPALFAAAFAVYSDFLCTHKGEQRTLFEVDDFGGTLGRLIKTIRIPNDKN